MHRWRKVRNLT